MQSDRLFRGKPATQYDEGGHPSVASAILGARLVSREALVEEVRLYNPTVDQVKPADNE